MNKHFKHYSAPLQTQLPYMKIDIRRYICQLKNIFYEVTKAYNLHSVL